MKPTFEAVAKTEGISRQAPQKEILDMTAGSRSMHFNKENPQVLFNDLRKESLELCDSRNLEINPDTQYDFRNLPFEDKKFSLVIFDPPHLIRAGENSWVKAKYGKLDPNTWQDDIKQGFSEGWRVLKENGTLIFKWSTGQIPTRKVLSLFPEAPICGGKRGKNGIFLVFFKLEKKS